MVANVKDKAVIVGVGNTRFSKESGVSELNLAVQAVKAACDDAGLHPSAIDGFATFTMDANDEIEVARTLGVGDITFWGRSHYGGGAATGSLHQAVMAVATGMAECVAVFRALNGRSGHRFSAGVSEGVMTADIIHWGWYMPYGLLTPASWVAMFTQRWMELTSVTKDAFFEVAHATREYAVNNPNAFFYQRPFDRAEYDAARMICDPLQLFDCSAALHTLVRASALWSARCACRRCASTTRTATPSLPPSSMPRSPSGDGRRWFPSAPPPTRYRSRTAPPSAVHGLPPPRLPWLAPRTRSVSCRAPAVVSPAPRGPARVRRSWAGCRSGTEFPFQ